jgi:hypothetical protein
LTDGVARVGAGLEEDLHDADAGIGRGLDVLDVVDGRGKRALELQHDAARHLVGLQAGVLPDGGDHGRRISGKMSVGVRRAASGPDDQDQQSEDNERVRPLEGDPNQTQHVAVLPHSTEHRPLPGQQRCTISDHEGSRLSSRESPCFLRGSDFGLAWRFELAGMAAWCDGADTTDVPQGDGSLWRPPARKNQGSVLVNALGWSWNTEFVGLQIRNKAIGRR